MPQSRKCESSIEASTLYVESAVRIGAHISETHKDASGGLAISDTILNNWEQQHLIPWAG